MILKTVIGTFLGFTIGCLALGLWKGEFDWSLWFSLSIGGTIGGTIGHFEFSTAKETNEENKEE